MTREHLGLPADWNVVEKWARGKFNFGVPLTDNSVSDKSKFSGLNFSKPADSTFWDNFPSRKLPSRPSTRVDIPQLRRAIHAAKKNWTIHEKKSAEKTLENLTLGAPSHQKSSLPGCTLKNSNSAIKHGAEFTETLEKWIQDGFVAGPFKSPPCENFRTNPVMAIEQKDKVRPVLNMSYPKDKSYNDNVDKHKVRKVRMSTARQVGQSLRAAGKGALMSKIDMKDAYKHVPARTADYRLQGFVWLGRYFLDTQLIFGASPAVDNYDNLGDTTLNVARSRCHIHRSMVHKALDDVIGISPAGSSGSESFAKAYKELCKEVNIKLAADCPNREKAFTAVEKGTVLGIQFNTANLTWRISSQKAADILSDIHALSHSGHADLKQVEKAAGRLNNFGQMCPFLQAFKRPLNDLLAAFQEDYNILIPVKQDLLNDLKIWAAVVSYSNRWLPIPQEMACPPLDALEFVSDAAGGTGSEDWAGVASLGLTNSGSFWYLCRGIWPQAILEGVDEKGAHFASKTTTLETVGLLLPLLTVPHVVQGRSVILGVDNTSVVFGWENRSVSGDMTASTLIRALHLVACFLECRIFTRHIPRESCLASVMADSLTRASTAKSEVWAAVTGAVQYDPPAPLWDWLQDPQTDWDLGFKLIDWLKSFMK